MRGAHSSDVKCHTEKVFGREIKTGKPSGDGWFKRSNIAFMLTVKMWNI